MTKDYSIRAATADDVAAIETLHDRAFGPGRFARTAYRVREGLPPYSDLCQVADANGKILAAVRMAPVLIGGMDRAQLLGPLAVEPSLRGLGIGKRVAAEAMVSAREAGIRLVLLVGDLPYYGRFGFNTAPHGRFDLGGPVNPARLLYLELTAGGLADYAGAVQADWVRASYR